MNKLENVGFPENSLLTVREATLLVDPRNTLTAGLTAHVEMKSDVWQFDLIQREAES